MATAKGIAAVAATMPNVPHWKIEALINKGTINPDNYDDPNEKD